MTVEQTSQLIQLILNSVLMVTACVIVLGVLLVRHTAVNNRLQQMNQEYFQLLSHAVLLRGARLLQIKAQLQQLRQRYRTSHRSLLSVYYALILLVVSTFLVALRTMIDWQGLITISLVFFTLGVGVLLFSIGFALLDFRSSQRSLWQEVNWVMTLGEVAHVKPPVQPRRSLFTPRRPIRRLPGAGMQIRKINSP
ncbi:MAG TPA: DUF2721 domain-containing protein [Crinalium sp.]|jgi:hypothetical protein